MANFSESDNFSKTLLGKMKEIPIPLIKISNNFKMPDIQDELMIKLNGL